MCDQLYLSCYMRPEGSGPLAAEATAVVILQIFAGSHPRLTIPHKTMCYPAVEVGLPRRGGVGVQLGWLPVGIFRSVGPTESLTRNLHWGLSINTKSYVTRPRTSTLDRPRREGPHGQEEGTYTVQFFVCFESCIFIPLHAAMPLPLRAAAGFSI